jgi:PIN domain nuclease of toxin-antitoxin system
MRCAVVFTGSDEIPPVVMRRLVDPNTELYLSDVSLLEIGIKYSIGKVVLSKPASRMIPTLREKHGMDPLPLVTAAIFRLEALPLLHRDPFDRLLIAQALVHDLTLVSPDPLIRQYPLPVMWG